MRVLFSMVLCFALECVLMLEFGEKTCGNDRFKCISSNECISKDWECDGDEDCHDGSDEIGCSSDLTKNITRNVRSCAPIENFECKNKKCFPMSYTCDYMDDCGDGSDESTTDGPLCVKSGTCPDDMFQCKKSKKCIIRQFVCDNENDCDEGDTSDEDDCGRDRKCISIDFKCDNGRCVDKAWLCDFNDDCGDRSDERNCNPHPCSQTFPRFKCKESGHCIFDSLRCNGANDCLDGSDETGCKTIKRQLPAATKAPGILILKTNSTFPVIGSKNLTDLEIEIQKTTLTASLCRKNYLTCPMDRSCVHKMWMCDGENDCSDGYDESSEICKCHNDQYKCSNNKCIPLNKKCDGVENCDNGEDENLENCPSSFNCTKGSYHCKHSSKCISLNAVCDNFKDCPNGDDEAINCGVNECLKSNGGCSHICVDTKRGHYCECQRGYQLNPDQKTCYEIDECNIQGYCSQICINLAGTFICQCDRGFVLKADKRTCKASGPDPYLIFSTDKGIRKISTNFENYRSIASNISNANSVDYDMSHRTIYWSDNTQGTIKCFDYAGKAKEEVLIEKVNPVALKVDWIGRKLYWTEKEKIRVSNLDGSYSKVIIERNNGEQFQALALIPDHGYIFWSDIGDNPKIERASLDGTNRTVIFNTTQVKQATFLAVDRHLQRLYWSDFVKEHIASSRFDGTDIRISIKVKRLECSMYGLSVFEDFVYWSCRYKSKITKANKFSGKIIQEFEEKFNAPLDITIYHPMMQRQVYHPCMVSSGGCSHLCFIANNNNGISHTCDCPDHMKLHIDGKTCIPKTITETICEGGYLCQISNRCVPKEYICDGVRHCEFNDDETNCPKLRQERLNENYQSSNLGISKYLPGVIGVSVGLIIVLIVIATIFRYRRRQNHLVEVSMVFNKDTEVIIDKDELDKVNEERNYPSTAVTRTRNIFNKNFDDSQIPLQMSHMDTECMVDEDNTCGEICYDDKKPIIT